MEGGKRAGQTRGIALTVGNFKKGEDGVELTFREDM